MVLAEKALLDNYNVLIELIKEHISSPRKEKLLALYEDYAEIIVLAPASGKEDYHNCFPGGYVEHVLRVVHLSIEMYKLWSQAGANINFTEEELLFSAINHDLGKVGMDKKSYYISNPSEWHRNNQGKIYVQNPTLDFMPIQDRSLFLLQQYNVQYTTNEYLGIKLHDGMYDEANKAYYTAWSDDGKLKTNLPYILHQADMIASKVEYDRWKNSKISVKKETKVYPGKSSSSNQMNTLSKNGKSGELFSKLFGEPKDIK